MQISRRSALKVGLSSLAYFSTELATPIWVVRSAMGIPSSCFESGRILVILQQEGGNDGLNTVIPRTDPVYYDAQTRPTIGVPAGSEINLDGLNGFHPRLSRLANWYQSAKIGIVHNVGYVNPNLSHFTATDYWEYGFSPGQAMPPEGWVTRYFDNAGITSPESLFMAAAGTSTVPDAMKGSPSYTPPAISDPANYSLQPNPPNVDATLRRTAISGLNSISTVDPTIDFLQKSENVAEASITDIATAVAQPDLVASGSYPNTRLGRGLKLVSQIIRAGFSTHIFYVSQGGYDTHANQIQAADPLNAGDHPVLLNELDQSLDSFLTEMSLSGNLDRVLVMTFSEFGRRVKENGSRGTDHGAANCLLLAGGPIKAGVYGGQPDLVNLTKGNLINKVDFRAVYARVMQDWIGCDATDVFGQSTFDTVITPDLPKIDFIQQPVNPNQLRSRTWTRY